MLKARWQGYEIDSSESAYGLDVPEQIQAGTYLRALLGSGYFVRSCMLLNEEPILRLHAFVQAHEEPGANICKILDKLVDKMQRPRGDVNVGVRAIESILNYVEANRQALLAENVFYTSGLPDEAGGKEADEEDEYEEESYYGEPPRRTVVLYLRSALVPYQKLSPEEQIEALEAGQAGWDAAIPVLAFGLIFAGISPILGAGETRWERTPPFCFPAKRFFQWPQTSLYQQIVYSHWFVLDLGGYQTSVLRMRKSHCRTP